jgi:SsrA-binding protein
MRTAMSTARGAKGREAGERLVAQNRRATYDYEIEDRIEAGLVLMGSEVKSLRAGRAEIADAYATIEGGEAWLYQLYVAPFEQATYFGHEPRRRRKLLMHRTELEKLGKSLERGGWTLIPLRVYFRDGRAKIELGLARGRTHGDKRQAIAKKTAEREAREAIGRAMKGRG